MDRMRKSPRPALPATVVAILMSMLVGCAIAGQTVEVGKLGPATRILVYRGGRPISERDLAEGSEEDRLIKTWLRSHADGWRTDRLSYAPQRHVRGPRFTLNFQADRCILNYQSTDRGRWIQVSRPIRRDDPLPAIFAEAR